MENITLELLLYLAAGAALGGYVNGLAGFGTGLMSLGIWLQVMTVEQAVPVVAAMSVASGVQSLWLTRQGVKTGSRLDRLARGRMASQLDRCGASETGRRLFHALLYRFFPAAREAFHGLYQGASRL